MKETGFRQQRPKLMLVLGLIYLVVVLAIGFIYFDALAEIVDGLASGGAKSAGLIVGAIVLVPLVLLLMLTIQRGHLRGDAETLSARIGRNETMLRNTDIARYTVNTPRVGAIRLYAADGTQQLELNPRPQDLAEVLEIIGRSGAYAEVERRSALRGRVTVLAFERRSTR